jgi:hypothetical protein
MRIRTAKTGSFSVTLWLVMFGAVLQGNALQSGSIFEVKPSGGSRASGSAAPDRTAQRPAVPNKTQAPSVAKPALNPGAPFPPAMADAKMQKAYEIEMFERMNVMILNAGQFGRLEAEAEADRQHKSRFGGGVWRLSSFYTSFEELGPKGAMPDIWKENLAKLQEWARQRPESATARIALAEGYIGLAWEARGSGYADAVSENQFASFDEYTQRAEVSLVEAAKLNGKNDPHWYAAMQQIALNAGWDKQHAVGLFLEATTRHPGYYQYYRELANYLLPKWNGDDGEVERFAEAAANHVGGAEGDFVYFEIATVVMCQCETDAGNLALLSWPRIKKGYAAMKQLYGTSSMKDNRMAWMAYLAHDRATAREAFTSIGDHWRPELWYTSERYENARAWAMTKEEAVR